MVKQFSAFLIFLIVLIFLSYIYYFSVDFPFQDDLLLIDFIEKVDSGNLGFATFFKELFKTYNDHKVVIPRLISLVDFKINGYLNFKTYIGLISINLLYILYFLYNQFKKIKLPLFYFLPVPLLFLHPQYHDVSLWAINGMQHSFLTAFLVSAIYLISKNTKQGFYGAVVFCFLATFTHGNGILSFPAIIFYLLCYKEFKKAAGFAGFMFLALGIYLAGYETGQAAGLPPTISVFVFSLLGFIGASMSEWDNYLLYAVLWGGLIVFFAAFLIFRMIRSGFEQKVNYKPQVNVELLTLLGFIFITSSVIAVFRSWQGVTLTSRFQLYAALSSCIFYLLLLNYSRIFRSKNVFLVITFLSIGYWAHTYYRYTDIVADKRTKYLADIYNWRYDKVFLTVEQSLLDNAAFYLFPAYKKGIFRLPESIISKNELDSLISYNKNSRISATVQLRKHPGLRPDKNDLIPDTTYYLVNEKMPGANSFFNDRFVVLRSRTSNINYLLCANPEKEGRKAWLTKAQYHKDGFQCFVQNRNFPTGQYEIGLLDINSKGEKKFVLFTESLIVQNEKLRVEP
ncbi:hypothetical protein [Dyadobacter sp. CY356]|uniref:hypothetical protein n=1 Tax=Dyadobacter sp. CY356 TaxID=2906442 RepID=UPI001F3C1ACB|nr:hypothetical protein [Dyadobacter sp. CY356]MCF0057388.1 hypothetical protein [Dyadobacter sp. CY356]